MMPRRSIHFLIVILLSLLAACGPQPTPTAPPAVDPTPPLQPINLGGPEMKVGSTYLYADGTLLVAVPAGIFTMGNGEATGRPENPAHPVYISDFWIYSTKVTNRQYAYCVAMGGCTAPYGPDNPGFNDPFRENDPVVGVDHAQAGAYCEFVHARLPSEAEWEKVARGPNADLYPWGDAAPSCALLNFATCFGETTPVNAYPDGRSYYGALDMEGNVLEWVADWFDAEYYLESPADDPQGPDSGRGRSVRSSAFNSGKDQIPAFTRSFSSPDTHRNNLGFRCVVEDPTYFAPFCTYPALYGDAAGGGDQSSLIQVDCPALSIEQVPYCLENGKFVSHVIFPTGQGLDTPQITWPAGSCVENFETNNLLDLVCSGPGVVSICVDCKVSVSLPAECPDGYSYDAASAMCLGPAGPGACLPGYQPGQTADGGPCCEFQPGTPAIATGPVSGGGTVKAVENNNCPAGTWSITGNSTNPICVPIAVQNPYCVQAGISLDACTPHGPGCPPPAGGCPWSGQTWNTNNCTCVCTNPPCG